MSILCLICKEKLVSYSPGVGCLNQLVENVIVATTCGHLYHLECLQSWFRTQKIKRAEDAIEYECNVCPTCLSPVKEDDNRRIFLLEDRIEALERAKLVEKHENLEIYCHQLEIQIHQLQRENDLMVNRILTPSSTNQPGEYDTIVKNDRVKWIKKDEDPVSGVVLSIFKKEGKLCAKIRLDRKIRTTQRANRLFSSFRSEKKQEVTVPFDEIVLEKDVNGNNTNRSRMTSPPPLSHPSENVAAQYMNLGYYGRSLSSSSLYSPYSYPNFGGNQINNRHSTLSLIDESRRQLFGIRESINESSSSIEQVEFKSNAQPQQATLVQGKPSLQRSLSYSPGFQRGDNIGTGQGLQIQSQNASQNSTGSDASLNQYTVITPPWAVNQMQNGSYTELFQVSPADIKGKHVTFADDHSRIVSSFVFQEVTVPGRQLFKLPEGGESELSINSNSDTPYANVATRVTKVQEGDKDEPTAQTTETSEDSPPQRPPKPGAISPLESKKNEEATDIPKDSTSETDCSSSLASTPTPQKEASFQFPNYEGSRKNSLSIAEDWTALYEDFDDPAPPPGADNSDCFAVTLLALLYCPTGFDKQMLEDAVSDNDLCRTVKWIIREKFATPLRRYHVVQGDYASLLKDSLMHLCSGTLDVEELLTILFEFIYKLPPFINYSLDMCDYLHQFFIDFTDKSKSRTVLELLNISLALQDNLKLEDVPFPALILQMPHSEDKIIHYDTVIPTLTLSLDSLLEKTSEKRCYCDSIATLECQTCSEFHGSAAVLFCDKCKDLLEGIHRNSDHKLKMVSTPKPKSTTLSLSAIVCLHKNRYSVFLKNGWDTYSPWIYTHAFVDGKLQAKQLPGFGYWLDSLLEDDKERNVPELPAILRKVLTQSRVFFYTAAKSSET